MDTSRGHDRLTDDDFTDLARLTDEALLDHARDPSAVDQAFTLLHFRHRDRVAGILANKLEPQLTEDLTQDVFIDLYDAIVDGKRIDNVRAWLNQVARNTIAEFYRGRNGRHLDASRGGLQLDDDTREGAPAELESEGGYGAVETSMVIDELLARRSAVHQEIVRLAVLESRAGQDVADATGKTPDNVYQVSKRFRDDLRAVLAGALDTPTDDRT